MRTELKLFAGIVLMLCVPVQGARISARQQLTSAKARLMSADYRADLAGLARIRDEITPLHDDCSLGYLAHYWTGFADWRIAINGANHGMQSNELQAHLEKAAADFDASIRQRGDFADSYAAAASVNGWLMVFHRDDAAKMRELITRGGQLLARANELEPDNLRVLWVTGGNFLFKPVEFGGSRDRAIEIYRHAVDLGGTTDARSPLPDWGKPEALMALAYAYANKTPPDTAAARTAAEAALRLQPDWSYVRDVLMPQIVAATRKN